MELAIIKMFNALFYRYTVLKCIFPPHTLCTDCYIF